MNNRLYFITTGLLTISLTTQAVRPKPNIIIIMADDLGYGDVSANGSRTIQTPNIDLLANGGIRFTRGYATSATSTPSRYAMFTGMYPWRNSEARILPGDAPLLIQHNQVTLPGMLQKAGYKTGAIGKWHLGMGKGNVDWNKQITPNANDVGFDYSCLIAATNDRVPTVYVKNGRVVGLSPGDSLYVNYNKNFDNEPTALTNPEMLRMKWSDGHNNSIVNGIPRIGFMKGGKSAHWVDEEMAGYFAGEVRSFIDAHQSEPFFLYYGLHQPHVPRVPHARFAGLSGMGPRGDAILEADWCVGELISHLQKLKLLENTLIIFTSDNGPVLDDGYYDDAVEKLGSHKPAGNLRGGKYSLFEAGTRVPFFVFWKDKIRPAISDALVCQLDFMASFSALVKQPVDGRHDSKNLLPVFLGKSNTGRKELITEAMGRLALVTPEWSYIPAYPGEKTNKTGNELGNLSTEALFRLTVDENQQNNLSKTEWYRLKILKSRFQKLTKYYKMVK